MINDSGSFVASDGSRSPQKANPEMQASEDLGDRIADISRLYMRFYRRYQVMKSSHVPVGADWSNIFSSRGIRVINVG